MTNLANWMKAATSAEQEALAKRAGTSRGYLYQVASSQRDASADLAGRLETAAVEVARKGKGRLPKLTRGDVCKACATCPYFKACQNKKG